MSILISQKKQPILEVPQLNSHRSRQVVLHVFSLASHFTFVFLKPRLRQQQITGTLSFFSRYLIYRVHALHFRRLCPCGSCSSLKTHLFTGHTLSLLERKRNQQSITEYACPTGTEITVLIILI